MWAEIPQNRNDAMLVGFIYRSPRSSEAYSEILNQAITEAVSLNNSHFLRMGDVSYPNVNGTVRVHSYILCTINLVRTLKIISYFNTSLCQLEEG